MQISGPHRRKAARDIRISLRRDIHGELNAILRMVKGEQLNRLLAGFFDRGKQTLEMQLPDGPSSDRHAWAAAVGEHGRSIGTTTTMRIFNSNVWSVFSIWHSVRLRQVGSRRLKFHDFLNALASAKMGKQPEPDGVVVEMVRALSWWTLLWPYLLFLKRLGGWEIETCCLA